VTGRRERRRRKLLDDLKERRGYSDLMEEALDRTVWGAGFERGFGPVVRQTAKWMRLVFRYFSGFGIKSCCCEFQDGLQSIVDLFTPCFGLTSPHNEMRTAQGV
jgi:hypothetical protein